MRRMVLPFAFAFLLSVGVLITVPANHAPLGIPTAAAQDAPPLPGAPSPDGDEYYDNVVIVATAVNAFTMVPERGSADFEIAVNDYSLPGAEASAPSPVQVRCDVVNETASGGKWSMQQTGFPQVRRNTESTAIMTVTTLPFPTPEFYRAEVACTTGSPIAGREIGRFNLTARVEPYSYLTLQPVGVPPTAGPDEIVEHTVNLKNNGNHPTTFYGSMDLPEGWRATFPEQVVLRPGEDRDLTIQVWTPRDKLIYITESELLEISYFPEGQPGKVQSKPFAVQVNGVYMHPALLPLTLLTVVLIGVIIFFIVLGRRAVEERILGKPVPPWRIPVERAYLQQLMKEDPDEFYIVRYYLMVEEHESALLWFNAFKAATKKDRKRESRWYKQKRKQERKVVRLEKAHVKFAARFDRKADKPGRKLERQTRKLERKLRRKERKTDRKAARKFRKKAKKIDKKHAKMVKRATKRFEKKRDKELKKVEKANKKRAKKGEDPLPLPELEPPQFEDPVLEEPKPTEPVPLEESRYAKKLERLQAKAAAKKERKLRKKERLVHQDRKLVDRLSARYRGKIPPEPETHLYDSDEYVPEDEVIVEDDRSKVAKWLHVPTLEERDRERRRRQVHKAEVERARAAGDEERAARLREDYRKGRRERAEARKEQIRAAAAQRKEERRLAAERKREIKERAKRIRHEEAPPEESAAPAEEGDAPIPSPPEPKGGYKVGTRKRTKGAADDQEAEGEAPVHKTHEG